MRVALYTVNFDNYDPLIPLICDLPDNMDAFYFTDKKAPSGWTERVVEPSDNLPPVARAKAIKILPWVQMPEYSAYIYVDANYAVIKDPTPLLVEDLVFMGHPNKRNYSIYEELKRLQRSRKKRDYTKHADFDAQAREYKERGVSPYPAPHIMASVIARKHTPEVRDLCCRWWKEFLFWRNWRDQAPLRYCLQEQQYKVLEPEEVMENYVSRLQHQID